MSNILTTAGPAAAVACLLWLWFPVLSGCGNLPDPYAPPAQRPLFEASGRPARVLEMAEENAESHFVRDIALPLEGSWRWTGKRPTARLWLESNQDVKYVIDFVIPGAALQQTGPVTLSFFANDHLLGSVRYSTDGRQRVELPVPSEWLRPGADATAAAEIDKIYVPGGAGPPLGFILHGIGFEQKK